MVILRARSVPTGARDIQEAFTEPRPAYTTILTALDRLVEKGEVIRLADSPRKVRFRAALSAEEDTSVSMRRALDGTADRPAALLKFAGDLDAHDADVLRAALRRRRRS